MFSITELKLHGKQEEPVFTYTLVNGINYFKGKKGPGKAKSYTFLDYMFGANLKLAENNWYRDTLKYAELTFQVDARRFVGCIPNSV